MKALSHTLGSVAMALLLLASTIPWTVGKHKCMGRIVDVALFADAEDCGMGLDPATAQEDGLQRHCCADEHITIVGQDDLRLAFNDLELGGQPVYLVPSAVGFWEASIGIGLPPMHLLQYPPPQLPKDRVVLHQMFLI
jgi:hypothetical protein